MAPRTSKKSLAIRPRAEIAPVHELPSLEPIEFVGEIKIYGAVDFEERAVQLWGRARESVARFGLFLRAALDQLPHGEIAEALDRVAARTGESPRVLRMAMAVAQAAGGPLLPGDPAAWLEVPSKAEVAISLARAVDDGQRQRLVEAGVLVPSATLATLRQARKSVSVKRPKAPSRARLEHERSMLLARLAEVEAMLARLDKGR